MPKKKGKNPKPIIDKDQNTSQHMGPDAVKKAIANISDSFLDEIKKAFTTFEWYSEEKRVEKYGNKQYLDQFREYFKEAYPNLLDKFSKEDLPIYIQTIKNEWFSLGNISQNASKLHEEFKHEDTEQHVIKKSLSELQQFCEDTINNVPPTTFDDFATLVGFDASTLAISPTGMLKTIDVLPVLWKKFLEKKSITLGETSAGHAERILTPKYNPTERILVTVAITKLMKELKGSLRSDFVAKFPLPVTLFDSHQDLLNFRDEWRDFLDNHASEIDESLAKKLDEVTVTNGDIYHQLLEWWRTFDDTKWFWEREEYFRHIFNKLATRQLFEKIQNRQETIDHYIAAIGDTFKEFPPYFNDILKIYPFNMKDVRIADSTYEADISSIERQLAALEWQISSAAPEQKKSLKEKSTLLRQEMEQRKWQAYIAFLKTKDTLLADSFAALVASKFNFSLLAPDQKQHLIDVLVKEKLEDTIINKVPELLDVQKDDLKQFVKDLFNLDKMDLTIPTKQGPVSLSFLKKEFLPSTRKQLPSLDDLAWTIKNIPLNFVAQLTEINAAFFEESMIFDSLYTNFAARDGKKYRINDAYKVRIKKNGKIVEWYLSAYAPLEENNRADYTGKELYLYSQPITSPNQERSLVTRPHEGERIPIPVVIKDNEQALCDIEILDKQLNLNGDAFWALLFGYVLGQQSMNTSMSSEKEDELAQKIGKLEVYKDTEEWEEDKENPLSEEEEKPKTQTEQQQFSTAWENIKWYPFTEYIYKDNHGFVKGSKICIPFADSEVPPKEVGKAWIHMEIIDINTDKWTFTVKFHGGELRLGKSEWATKELPMHLDTLKHIKKAFGDNLYKLPDMKGKSFDQQMAIMTTWSLVKDVDKNFGSVKFTWSAFSYTLGEYTGKDVSHFGIYQPKVVGESLDQESGKLILYKIRPNANGTITVSWDSTPGNYAKNFPARDMDYASFILFVKEKWLQPKCKEQIQAITTQATASAEEIPTTVRWFSINNIISFFKNGASKIKDGVKKYDDERTEELNDILTNQGQLWTDIWWFLSPFSRISSSFESMGMEQFLERDNRIWKKVEKRTKFYEDFDYAKLYSKIIAPMLSWAIQIVPHYKLAAILLVHLKKGKWPYAKSLPIADGKWIGMLLGADHQHRYLAIREKKIRDLEQNAHIYGGAWADDIKNQLVELEMRYIVHVMDGREMGMWDPEKYKFQDKYSKTFCDELEWAYTWFYKQNTVEEWFTKAQDNNFEFARVEYFRLLADRPQQALPFLKVMATKAINDTQWQIFETAVLAGILSGVFLNMTYSDTQSYIQKICRTRWFVPWIFAKDIKQQYKIQRILDMFSNKAFTNTTWYDPSTFSFRNSSSPSDFIKKFSAWTDESITLWTWDTAKNTDVRKALSNFLKIEWPNAEGKTLLDLYGDTALDLSDKLLLKEYIKNTNEKNEGLDKDVEHNTSSLTWSILTKSQSVVEKMIKFDKNGFAGQNGDEIQNMKAFSENMETAVPKNKIRSPETVKFFVGKFFNRFGERWFSWLKMTEFLKRLKWCKQNPWSPETETILYYSVVWEILNSLGWNEASPPDELIGALWAWKLFFQNNLESILQSEVITSCFGWSQYLDEYNKITPKLKDRALAIPLLDKDENQLLLQSSNQIERKQVAAQKHDLLSPKYNYINPSLFATAETLSKKCSWYPNRFKKAYYQDKKTNIPSQPSKATWAKITNPSTVDQIRQILSGNSLEEDDSDAFLSSYLDDD